jgi:hypothetical protein
MPLSITVTYLRRANVAQIAPADVILENRFEAPGVDVSRLAADVISGGIPDTVKSVRLASLPLTEKVAEVRITIKAKE